MRKTRLPRKIHGVDKSSCRFVVHHDVIVVAVGEGEGEHSLCLVHQDDRNDGCKAVVFNAVDRIRRAVDSVDGNRQIFAVPSFPRADDQAVSGSARHGMGRERLDWNRTGGGNSY